jgi:hypothetical protein
MAQADKRRGSNPSSKIAPPGLTPLVCLNTIRGVPAKARGFALGVRPASLDNSWARPTRPGVVGLWGAESSGPWLPSVPSLDCGSLGFPRVID